MTTTNTNTLRPEIYVAIASALLFGVSTPAAKWLMGQTSPQQLAGILYLGSGLGLTLLTLIRRKRQQHDKEARLKKKDLPWLAAAIIVGGILAPLLLMFGLRSSSASSASLLLNLEAVFTALLAWLLFKENFDRRIFLGMIAIVLGSVILALPAGVILGFSIGALSIAGACLCWAIDNNLTRNIAQADPVQIAAIKGFVAGTITCAVALAGGNALPEPFISAVGLLVGFLGYGISLVLFIRALRHLGTARTGAYFATAPFAGAVFSIIFLGERITANLCIAASLMALGVWLHISENHNHEHTHKEQEHEHLHTHDEHHQHEHEANDPPGEPHTHWHKHAALSHSHPHYPDLHHRHDHE